jgi:hypothetical protein
MASWVLIITSPFENKNRQLPALAGDWRERKVIVGL